MIVFFLESDAPSNFCGIQKLLHEITAALNWTDIIWQSNFHNYLTHSGLSKMADM